jgi:N-glycosyltransferase
MRILFSSQNVPTHLRALLPVIRAAQRAGHTLAVAAAKELGGELAAHGLEHIVAGREWLAPLAAAEIERVRPTTFQQFRDAQPSYHARMAGEPAVDTARDIVAAAGRFRPDLIVRECMEFGGALAAEKLGVPSVCVGTGSYVPEAFSPSRMAEIIAPSRRALDLPEDPAGTAVYRFLYASLMPRQFDPQVDRIPNARYYQDGDLAAGGGQIPEWLADISEDRPLVYACLSSVALAYSGVAEHVIRMMEAMILALGKLDCTALVAIGSWVKPERFGPQPPHVHLTDYAPQKLLLQCADLFVTHAGYASIRESVRAGVPMVTIPSIGDTMYSAACAEDSGIARNVSLEAITEESIRQACVDVLSNPGYVRAVSRLQRQMLALPSLDALIADLEKLATREA